MKINKALWLLLFIIPFLFVGDLFADNSQWNFTKDSTFERGYYVPKNLDECFVELNKALDLATIQDIKTGHDIKYHFSLGLFIRNNWLRGQNSRLANYFVELGILSFDDMSGIILKSYSRYLNGRDIELQNQVKRYQNYYYEMKAPTNLICPNDGTLLEIVFIKMEGSIDNDDFKCYHFYQCKKEQLYLVYQNGIGWHLPTEKQREWIKK